MKPAALGDSVHRRFLGRWDDSPGRGEPCWPSEVAEVGYTGEGAADCTATAARRAFPDWSRIPLPARGQILIRATSVLRGRRDQVAVNLSREVGKILPEVRGEVRCAADILGYFGTQMRGADGETYPCHDALLLLVTVRCEPLGVVR